MNGGRILECTLGVQRGAKGSQQLVALRSSAIPALAHGRVPRLTKLLALAHKFEGLLREGIVADYATLARLGHVSRARITQIMNLLCLAPDIQEEILFLPRTMHGRDPLQLRRLQPVAQILDWRRQRARWRQLMAEKYPHTRGESSGDRSTFEVTDDGRAQRALRGCASFPRAIGN